ncbi:MAG: stimulus-sensing domain-containing protein [Alphaproteobacteria bacterium]|nr:stimulus-sensing domain-containing protein [Alphaproteobacteria bacterium]
MAVETTDSGSKRGARKKPSARRRARDRGQAARTGTQLASSAAERPARFRSLTWRVLAVNLLGLVIFAAGLLYLDRYKQSLIRDQLDSLATQGGIFAAALGEAAVTTSPNAGRDFLTAQARPMVRRLAAPAGLRARLFAANGDLIADSRYYGTAGGKVQVTELPPPPQSSGILGMVVDLYDWIVRQFPARRSYPLYIEHAEPRAENYAVTKMALIGEVGREVLVDEDGRLVMVVAVPVQRYKQVLGALMLSVDEEGIEMSLRSVRLEILTVFAGLIFVTVLLSLWLAGTIARPVRRLAGAADRVRFGRAGETEIPDFTKRGDEIGDLSAALREMTEALWSRMEAIERFAADVAHEIKNPLTSLRSAVETAARLDDPQQQQRLMAIILDDVQRLDRLISDISDASRLDAELSRADLSTIDVKGLLTTLVEVERIAVEGRGPEAPEFRLEMPEDEVLRVVGMEDRIAQVLRNLISNAVSFSPPGGTIRLTAARRGAHVRIAVEDQGPGLPAGKFDAVFERFYTERPEGEKFGTHSGLGLSISKQIVTAHHGRIWAENIERDGRVVGARFTVSLPAVRNG